MVPTALVLILVAALLGYLSSPRQNWRAAALPRRMQLLALVVALAGTFLWSRAIGPAAGIAAAFTATMLAWVLAPYLGWWRGRHARDGARR